MSLDDMMQTAYAKNYLLYFAFALFGAFFIWVTWRAIKGKPAAILVTLLVMAAIGTLFLYLTREP